MCARGHGRMVSVTVLHTVHERTRPFTNVPHRSQTYHTVHERTRPFTNVPDRSRTYQTVRERTRSASTSASCSHCCAASAISVSAIVLIVLSAGSAAGPCARCSAGCACITASRRRQTEVQGEWRVQGAPMPADVLACGSREPPQRRSRGPAPAGELTNAHSVANDHTPVDVACRPPCPWLRG